MKKRLVTTIMARVLVVDCVEELMEPLLTEGIATILSWFEPTNAVTLVVAPDEDTPGRAQAAEPPAHTKRHDAITSKAWATSR
jgi:hypothetical protein